MYIIAIKHKREVMAGTVETIEAVKHVQKDWKKIYVKEISESPKTIGKVDLNPIGSFVPYIISDEQIKELNEIFNKK